MEGVRRSLLVLLAAALLCAAPTAHAQDVGGFDTIDQADVLQKQAQKAADEGNWRLARQLAEEVLTLDVSFATAPARLVLVRALEAEENYDAALYELKQFFRLKGLEPDVVEQGKRLERRVVARRDGDYAPAPTLRTRPAPPRGAGIGLMIGGGVPLVLGGVFVFNDVHHAVQGNDSGTWAAMGAPILGIGVALEVIGAVVIAKSRPSGQARPSAARPVPRLDGFSLGYDGEGVRLGLRGRF